MQVTVFGASGNIGRRVIEILLDKGYSVVAFVHRADLPAHDRLTIVRGDVHQSEDIIRAVNGSQAVISTLGSWHTPDKNVLSSAMERLIPAMKDAGINRVISLTGASAFSSHDTPSLFDKLQHTALNAIAPRILRDGEEHIRLLEESGLDWTVIRSPVMNEIGTTGFILSPHFPLPWQTIHRSAVATCMVEMLENSNYSKQAPFIVRG